MLRLVGDNLSVRGLELFVGRFLGGYEISGLGLELKDELES